MKIYYVKSNVATLDDGLSKINNIDGNDLLAVMMQFEVDILNKKKNEQETEMANYISNNYSWNRISTLLYEHFCKLIVN
jgi:hypothetical protein